jgi:hypothetical protein
MAPTAKQILDLVIGLKRRGFGNREISYFLHKHGYPRLGDLARMFGLGKRKKKQQGRGRVLTPEEGESVIALNKVANNGKFKYKILFTPISEDEFRSAIRRGAITWKNSLIENLQDLVKNLEKIAPAVPDVWAAVQNPYDPQALLKAGKAIVDAGKRVAGGRRRTTRGRGGLIAGSAPRFWTDAIGRPIKFKGR